MKLEHFRNYGWAALASAGLASLCLLTAPSRVEACGGLFCNSNRAVAVNQAAEEIIFAKNADGTVTAVIQIMYEGSAAKFAWVLPVPGVPTVGLSSNLAFTQLKQATNPSYQLNYQQTACKQAFNTVTSAPVAGVAMGSAGSAAAPAVTVEASGSIGPYDYDVISVNSMLTDRAQVAVDWLTAHSFDVGPMGADVLRPYLDNDLNLIAFKLTKNATTGSIRPVMLNFGSGLPAIPIRPTAVAANDNMGVMVWVLADSRAIPQNYKALELNDALINWFMPNSNYNDVVSKAADEAMGQGFVTEFAGSTMQWQAKTGGGLIFSQFQQQQFDQFMTVAHPDAMTMIRDAMTNWGAWDGFDDALQAAVTLPSTIAFSDFKNCLACYLTAQGVTFNQMTFLTGIYEKVIKPMADTQALIDASPYATRLYTTMSADEMTLDPAFDFNSDLGDVSNIHTATIETQCGNQGPWAMTLPQGTIHGTTVGTWPVAIDSEPAALKILEYGKSGAGKVVDDRTTMVMKLLETTASGTGGSSASGTGGATGKGTGGSSSKGTGGSSATGGSNSTVTGGMAGTSVDQSGSGGTGGSTTAKASGGCNVGGQGAAAGAAQLLLAAFVLLGFRRRARRA